MSVLLWAGGVFALEISVSPAYSFNYEYYSQRGQNGFFGPYNVDNSSTGGNFAPLNGWLGANVVSGSGTGDSYNVITAIPKVKLNEAVEFGGVFRIGPYFTATRPGVSTVISSGDWTRMSVFVRTPWGQINYGKFRFGRGCGFQFGISNRTEEFLFLQTGPTGWPVPRTNARKLMWATGKLPEDFKALTKEQKKEAAKGSEETVESLEALADDPDGIYFEPSEGAPLNIGLGVYLWRRGSVAYWDQSDLNSARAADLICSVTYRSGRIEAGAGGTYAAWHEGPEAQATTALRISAPPSDTFITEGWTFFQYCGPIFFFNTEADWYYRTVRYQSSLDGTFFGAPALIPGGGGSLLAPRHVQSWRYMVETGLNFGPLKLTFLYTHMPGPDRLRGILIDRQSFIQEDPQSARQVFAPYSLLMAPTYKSGINSPADMSDANTFAGKIDYLLASNLNVSACLVHARRVSHGYGWGYIRPDPVGTFGSVEFAQRGSFSSPAPAIPDNNLGWEANFCLNWNLLAGPWTLGMQAAYWWPGRWFHYACVDKSVPNWDLPTVANNFGANPNRTIDPIFGFLMSLTANL